ncbi:MAG: hypothetical protein AMQ22_00933 [Candidatus Methanofastidiosum methylothiophilum]|uniref:Uncharacterized protein n=1 Tax=Candidatus Methanofastidiosum methylothiophilum TaxID=1705564 RepID=A0A150J4Q3_9EURY|nr:MAG: hypothetical protein AMQ22_00933 [Candidatus Methanofastidiosum methylthiophilus]
MAGMTESRGLERRMTELLPEDEIKFQKWVKNLPWYSEFKAKVGKEPNLDSTDYDYRAAYLAGVKPAKYKEDNTYHWPSQVGNIQLKNANHPTAWMNDFMSSTGTDPLRLGIRSPEEAWNYYRNLK